MSCVQACMVKRYEPAMGAVNTPDFASIPPPRLQCVPGFNRYEINYVKYITTSPQESLKQQTLNI